MILIITIVFLFFITVAIGLYYIQTSNLRSQQLQALALKQPPCWKWQYRPFASLSSRLKKAQFQIFNQTEGHIFRHLVEGYYPRHSQSNESEKSDLSSFNLLDCSLITQRNTLNQTLLMVELNRDLLPINKDFHCVITPNSRQSPYKPYTSNENSNDALQRKNDKNLVSLSTHQIPAELNDWLFQANNPGKLAMLITQATFKHWLLTYPHLHIEITADILLLYKQDSIIEAQDITRALDIANELQTALSLAQ